MIYEHPPATRAELDAEDDNPHVSVVRCEVKSYLLETDRRQFQDWLTHKLHGKVKSIKVKVSDDMYSATCTLDGKAYEVDAERVLDMSHKPHLINIWLKAIAHTN